MPKIVVEIDSNGEEARAEEDSHFEVIKTMEPLQRPHLIRTIATDEDVMLNASLAILVQWFAVRMHDVDVDDILLARPDNAVTIYAETEATWITPADIADFATLGRRLRRWQHRTSPEPACREVYDPVVAVPLCLLTDPSCPVLWLIRQLTARRWRSHYGVVVHTTTDARRVMDAREDTRMRPYLQVVLDINKYLRLCDTIPSDQPMAFFELLLAGQRVVPGEGNAAYKLQLAQLTARRKKMPLLAVEDAPVVPPVLPLPGLRISGGTYVQPAPPRPKAKAVVLHRRLGPPP